VTWQFIYSALHIPFTLKITDQSWCSAIDLSLDAVYLVARIVVYWFVGVAIRRLRFYWKASKDRGKSKFIGLIVGISGIISSWSFGMYLKVGNRSSSEVCTRDNSKSGQGNYGFLMFAIIDCLINLALVLNVKYLVNENVKIIGDDADFSEERKVLAQRSVKRFLNCMNACAASSFLHNLVLCFSLYFAEVSHVYNFYSVLHSTVISCSAIYTYRNWQNISSKLFCCWDKRFFNPVESDENVSSHSFNLHEMQYSREQKLLSNPSNKSLVSPILQK
jgi:hypothetical protein